MRSQRKAGAYSEGRRRDEQYQRWESNGQLGTRRSPGGDPKKGTNVGEIISLQGRQKLLQTE
ncbi:MAG: hypothetical protein DWQ02_26430 [Bacteroidetes bacterium]|nr:MAG: hypothetical protein DWQ02_26430 [Bacteroidota bacterium]